MEKALKKLGLTDTEISIYLSLFELGPSTAAKIAEKNKLHRTNAYDYLDRLIKKGLVNCTIQDNVKYFNITNPNNILSYIEKIKEDLDKNKKNIEILIREFKKTKPAETISSRIETFQGKQGLESFYEKLIGIAASKDEILIIGSSERIMEIFNYYLLNLTKKIFNIKVKVKMIANKDIMKDKYMKIIAKMIDLKMKHLPLDYLSPTATFIFKDYVGFCNFMENPFVILINDKAVSNSYKRYFGMMWDKEWFEKPTHF